MRAMLVRAGLLTRKNIFYILFVPVALSLIEGILRSARRLYGAGRTQDQATAVRDPRHAGQQCAGSVVSLSRSVASMEAPAALSLSTEGFIGFVGGGPVTTWIRTQPSDTRSGARAPGHVHPWRGMQWRAPGVTANGSRFESRCGHASQNSSHAAPVTTRRSVCDVGVSPRNQSTRRAAHLYTRNTSPKRMRTGVDSDGIVVGVLLSTSRRRLVGRLLVYETPVAKISKTDKFLVWTFAM